MKKYFYIRLLRVATKVAGLLVLLALGLFSSLLPARVMADSNSTARPTPRPSLELEVLREVRGGEDGALLVVWIEMPAGYHAYANDPDGQGGGGVGLPTVVTVRIADAGAGVVGLPVVFYPPGREAMDVLSPGQRVRVYEGRAPVFVRLPRDHLDRELAVSVSLLLCSERNCLPFRDGLTYRVDAASLPGLPGILAQPWYAEFRGARAVVQTGSAASGSDAGQEGERDASAGQPSPPGQSAGAGLPAAAREQGASPSVGGAGGAGGDRVTISTGRVGRSVPMPGMAEQPHDAGTVQGSAKERSPWNFAPRYHVPELEVSGLGKALLLGLLAGLLLNLMPCVLPVISLKLSGFVAVAGVGGEAARRSLFREHNLLFAGGIMAWFLLLAFILGGAGLAWGQLFQRPGVVLGLLLVVFCLGLSMFGLFTLPVLDLKAAAGPGGGRAQPFFAGMMATLLATPCSGPFLGGVLGWAFQQPPEIMAFVFTSVGMGMALPYLALAARPSLVRHLPKPGAWTGTLEQLVGFFLMGTALYLLTILPDAWLMPSLVSMLFAALAAWIWGRWSGPDASARRRVLVRLAAAGLLGVGVWLAFAPKAPPARWEAYDATAFRAALGKEPLIVDFTADWCPNCKFLEQTTLSDAAVAEWARSYGARLVRVDLTGESPEGQALLRALGSSSIPVVALFPKGLMSASPVVLRDLFTTGQMEQALLEAFGKPKQEWKD